MITQTHAIYILSQVAVAAHIQVIDERPLFPNINKNPHYEGSCIIDRALLGLTTDELDVHDAWDTIAKAVDNFHFRRDVREILESA